MDKRKIRHFVVFFNKYVSKTFAFLIRNLFLGEFDLKRLNMSTEKNKYSPEELKEFEVLINEKLDKARGELNMLKQSLSRNNESGGDGANSYSKVLEDGADTLEKEAISQLAARQQKFINNLENALVRIKNSTYGVCVDTGKLISKERLRAVPHTMHSIEAKLNQKK